MSSGTRPASASRIFHANAAIAQLGGAGFVARDGEDDDVVLRRRDQLRVEGHAQGGVEDDAQQRPAAAQAAAVGHPGIVGENRVDADHGGVGGPAQGLHGGAGGVTCNPIRGVGCLLRGRRRNARVERHGNFHQHQGAVVLDPAREALVEAAGFGLAGADGGFDARGTQCS